MTKREDAMTTVRNDLTVYVRDDFTNLDLDMKKLDQDPSYNEGDEQIERDVKRGIKIQGKPVPKHIKTAVELEAYIIETMFNGDQNEAPRAKLICKYFSQTPASSTRPVFEWVMTLGNPGVERCIFGNAPTINDEGERVEKNDIDIYLSHDDGEIYYASTTNIIKSLRDGVEIQSDGYVSTKCKLTENGFQFVSVDINNEINNSFIFGLDKLREMRHELFKELNAIVAIANTEPVDINTIANEFLKLEKLVYDLQLAPVQVTFLGSGYFTPDKKESLRKLYEVIPSILDNVSRLRKSKSVPPYVGKLEQGLMHFIRMSGHANEAKAKKSKSFDEYNKDHVLATKAINELDANLIVIKLYLERVIGNLLSKEDAAETEGLLIRRDGNIVGWDFTRILQNQAQFTGADLNVAIENYKNIRHLRQAIQIDNPLQASKAFDHFKTEYAKVKNNLANTKDGALRWIARKIGEIILKYASANFAAMITRSSPFISDYRLSNVTERVIDSHAKSTNRKKP